jgi:hypothetical protein
MATYLANNYSTPFVDAPMVGVQLVRDFSFTASVAIALNDLIKLSPIKAGTGIVIDGWYISVPDLDTGATLAFQLGDNTTAARFMAANTVGQAPGVVYSEANGVNNSLPFLQTTDTDLVLKVSTGPAGGGTSATPIRGFLKYHTLGAPHTAIAT